MRAIVLAAGEGSRLRPHTADRPKCLVELAGAPLLDRQLETLRQAGIEDIALVTGYREDQLEAKGLPTFHNPRYAESNMVYSLMCAEPWLDGSDDLLICYSDIVYEPAVPAALMACDEDLATAVDLDWRGLWELRMEDPLNDAETLRMDESGAILELGNKPQSMDQIEGQYVGLIRVGKAKVPELVKVYRELEAEDEPAARKMFMTSFLTALMARGWRLAAACVKGGWLEVDTVEDLATYEMVVAAGGLEAIYRRQGAACSAG